MRLAENEIWFRINGDPKGKARARCTCRGGRPRMYADPATAVYQVMIKELANEAFRGVPLPLRGPVEVHVLAVRKRPKSRMRKKDENERELDVRKPDADNIKKAVLDALVWSDVLTDDACVWRSEVEKWMADKEEKPHLVVTIRWGYHGGA